MILAILWLEKREQREAIWKSAAHVLFEPGPR
jgi:hypothetical protein